MNDSPELSPEMIVNQLISNDAFSKWLGVKIIKVEKGTCTLECTLKNEMLNGYKIVHGGIIFSLADSAIAFASATYGRLTVAIDHSVSFIQKATPGDVLTAKAKTISMSHKTGVIYVEIKNKNEELIAIVKGTVYRKREAFKA